MNKVNLLLDNPGGVRNGYLNIDPHAPERSPDGRIRAKIEDLSHTLDFNECEELVAHDILDYFGMEEADQVLNHWLSRLAHQGTLSLSVVDLREVARDLLANALDIADINELLYGRQTQPWQLKKCVFTLPILVNMLQSRGYKILTKKSSDYRAIVTVQRP